MITDDGMEDPTGGVGNLNELARKMKTKSTGIRGRVHRSHDIIH